MGATSSSKDMIKRQIETHQRIIDFCKTAIANTRKLMKDPHNKNNVPSYKLSIANRQNEIKQRQEMIKSLREQIKRIK